MGLIKKFGYLKFEIYLGFVIWNLGSNRLEDDGWAGPFCLSVRS